MRTASMKLKNSLSLLCCVAELVGCAALIIQNQRLAPFELVDRQELVEL